MHTQTIPNTPDFTYIRCMIEDQLGAETVEKIGANHTDIAVCVQRICEYTRQLEVHVAQESTAPLAVSPRQQSGSLRQEPSPGALRAAENLNLSQLLTDPLTGTTYPRQKAVAEIIDHETAAPILLDALQYVQESVRHLRSNSGVWHRLPESEREPIERLEEVASRAITATVRADKPQHESSPTPAGKPA